VSPAPTLCTALHRRRQRARPRQALQILASRPDLDQVVLPMPIQRLPCLTNEEIMVIAAIPMEELRHTRAAQDWLAGRQRRPQS
jgi:hypothetical protein